MGLVDPSSVAVLGNEISLVFIKMRKIKILYTIPNFITAGSGGAMLNIIRRLDKSQFEPAVCVSKLGGKLDDEVGRLGLPLIDAQYFLKAKPYTSLLMRVINTAKIFKPHHFDLWHSFHYADDYTEPLVAYFSGATGWVYTKKNMNWHSNAWHVRSLLAKGIAVQNSDMLRDFFAGITYRHKTSLIPRGVDTQKFSPNHDGCQEIRQTHMIDTDAVLIGCVAHLVPVKGHPTLIEAVSGLDNVHVFLAGEAMDLDYASGLKTQVQRLGLSERVHFLGNVPDIPAFLAQMDLAVLPTWNRWRKEGCPVALLEAMACGKACVATDVPGSRDIIEDGVSGLLVPAQDAAALAVAIKQLAQSKDLRERMGAAARERVVSHFSIEKEVSAHQQLYLDVMARKGLFRGG